MYTAPVVGVAKEEGGREREQVWWIKHTLNSNSIIDL